MNFQIFRGCVSDCNEESVCAEHPAFQNPLKWVKTSEREKPFPSHHYTVDVVTRDVDAANQSLSLQASRRFQASPRVAGFGPRIAAAAVQYHASPEEPLMTSVFMRRGPLVRLNDDMQTDPVVLSIFVNGFMGLTPRGALTGLAEHGLQVAWGPFATINESQMFFHDHSTLDTYFFFKADICPGSTHLFAVRGPDAENQRESWMNDMSRAIRLLTRSLFPQFPLAWNPIPHLPQTANRILAGYLLRSESQHRVSLLYAQLSMNCTSATLMLYDTDACLQVVGEVKINKHMKVVERPGLDCSSFFLREHLFCAKSFAVKQLWIWVLTTIVAKLTVEVDDTDVARLREMVRLRCLSSDPCSIPAPSNLNGPGLRRVWSEAGQAFGDKDDSFGHEEQQSERAEQPKEVTQVPASKNTISTLWPQDIFVVSPNIWQEFSGIYVLQDGPPFAVYRQLGTSRLLFSSQDGRWHIGDGLLTTSRLYHPVQHQGKSPLLFETGDTMPWWVFDEDSWRPDRDVQIRRNLQETRVHVFLPGEFGAGIEGIYELCKEFIDAMPMYVRIKTTAGLPLKIYSAGGFWHIGQLDSSRQKFLRESNLNAQCDVGSCAYHTMPHGGRSPDLLPPGGWHAKDSHGAFHREATLMIIRDQIIDCKRLSLAMDEMFAAKATGNTPRATGDLAVWM